VGPVTAGAEADHMFSGARKKQAVNAEKNVEKKKTTPTGLEPATTG